MLRKKKLMAGSQAELPGGVSCPCGAVGWGAGVLDGSCRKLRCAPGLDLTKLHNTGVGEGERFLTEGTLLSSRSGISNGFEQKNRAEALQADLVLNKFISYIQKWN